MDTGLHILYTANVRGNLDMLPRLYTFLRQMKALPLDEGDDVLVCAVQPVARPTLVLDLGDSCSPDVWHCAATSGRSVLIVLDAMGYQAANVSGMLTAEAHERLHDNLMKMALVDEASPFEENGVLIMTSPPPSPLPASLAGSYSRDASQGGGGTQADFRIILVPSDATRLDGNTLYLASVEAGQIGVVHIASGTGRPRIQAHSIFDLSPATPPDATISATVDFVLNEARALQRKSEVKK